jgi:hypothetical protein
MSSAPASAAAATPSTAVVMEDVVKVHARRESSGNYEYEYVVRVADIPGGLNAFLEQVKAVHTTGERNTQCYHKGQLASWADVPKDNFFKNMPAYGSLLDGLIRHKAIWSSDANIHSGKCGYLTPLNQRIVWSGSLFPPLL